MPEASADKVVKHLSKITYPKGYHILEAGKTETNIFFIEKGIARAYIPVDGKEVTLQQIAGKATCGVCSELQVVKEYSSPISPPPFMVGAAEVEVDKETGQIDVIDYVGVIDCGTPINPNLARVQAEGGIGQGIGMVLYEDVQYTDKGKIRNNSFMQYKIPNRMDIPKVRIEFESSYEKTGPFGAKSIGELVIDTPCPAIANAVYNATGVRVRELPITPEKVAMGILAREAGEKV